MPTTLIEVRRQYTEAEEAGLIDAVHSALVTAFRIPPQDKHVRLVVHEPHRFACSPNQTKPECYTLVTIDCFAGRSVEAKRSLYREIVEQLAVFGIPGEDITITLRESPTENWGLRGGQAASDIDLGFNVNV